MGVVRELSKTMTSDQPQSEWSRPLETIEGDIQPDSHDWVSNLKPKDDGTVNPELQE